jgi:hypothetical protein
MKKTALVAGVFYLITFISIPTQVLYGPVKNRRDWILRQVCRRVPGNAVSSVLSACWTPPEAGLVLLLCVRREALLAGTITTSDQSALSRCRDNADSVRRYGVRLQNPGARRSIVRVLRLGYGMERRGREMELRPARGRACARIRPEADFPWWIRSAGIDEGGNAAWWIGLGSAWPGRGDELRSASRRLPG